ncbi:hypothetical protein DSLASN_35610 [Desulfoluna limicola]|uniref:DUF4177 domain-containing protein n=1 Tax=Desulfoluna limicola TaxID=2810562 RepID=A0ABM7PKQ1_9BACT|nr:DUF4177 domain-containing protein [Desulfoluna limicola]BCS97929.1 hypothetical protein DSLASN_35610 [Desulfoluna limicola]
MAYTEYKVITVVEGGLGTIFLGASGIPTKKMETTLNKEAEEGWNHSTLLSRGLTPPPEA